MKKLIMLFSLVMLLSSCVKSEEEKLNDLISQATKDCLLIPDSYEPVSTECDSIFRDVLNPAGIRKAKKLIELAQKADKLQQSIDYNTDKSEYWSGRFSDIYDDYDRKVKQETKKRDALLKQAKDLLSEIMEPFTAEPEFCGFYVQHTFRAKNNAGRVLMKEYVFLLNEDKSEIVDMYDAMDDDFLAYVQLLGALQELDTDTELEDIDIIELCSNIKSKYELMLEHLHVPV